MQQPLEKSRLFPILAWIAILAFIVLAYYLATGLQKQTSGLSHEKTTNEDAIDRDLRTGKIEY